MDNAIIVGFFAETELHPGAGQGLGTIDQPVQREGGSKFPVVPGTSYKGAAKSELVDANVADAQLKGIFGEVENGGTVAFGDIRLLLLPMRCSDGAYKWVTTPLLLQRFYRDVRRAKLHNGLPLTISAPLADRVLTDGSARKLYIEEFQFSTAALPQGKTIADLIGKLLPPDPPYDEMQNRLETQLLVMNDDDFGWFCEYGLPVRPHNALDPKTKASNNFWYEEYLPADTMMYALNTTRSAKAADLIRYGDELASRKWLQLGGNETTGEGVCRIHVWKQ